MLSDKSIWYIEKSLYLHQNGGIMAVYVKAIPTLRGSAAERFVKMSEENLRRRASVDFSKEAANSYAILKKKVASK